MEANEFNDKMADIAKIASTAKRKLRIEYALSNNPYKKGDVVTDFIGTIRIDYWDVAMPSFEVLPVCVYYGYELKKDLTPKKNKKIRGVWQSNIKSSTEE